ncbi:GntR family transcriptional regulator [Olsenella sp. Marseille-P4559]|uniref:GntR family transcriptional regulator n=1 Tax=Olsenella sp. Marseille-P4559 TaxID=2364795 RepID=UPI0010306D84|nr:GntR family transcriptional regulator [Olsenella sp. Marseille-P4559]
MLGDNAEISTGGSVCGNMRDASRPRYLTVAEVLRKMIYNYELEPGERIPSEHELMDRFDIARGTARHAIKLLVEEGLLKQAHGRGTFVSSPDITHNVGDFPLSFAQSLTQQGKEFTTRLAYSKVEVPPPAMQVALDIRPGYKALYLERVRMVEGAPLLAQESWVSLVECSGIERSDFERDTLFDCIERCSGRRVKSSVMTYSARNSGPKYASILGCDESTALLVLEQVMSLDDGRPVSWDRTWLRPGQTVTGTTRR